MKEQFNYFWWDGGFESVHNRLNKDINPDGTAHILTPNYRLDISRFLASPTGLEINKDTSRYLYGSVLQDTCYKITTDIVVCINGREFMIQKKKDENRALMVYDAGSVCHQLRLKGITLIDSDGNLYPEEELEMILYIWNDLISLSVQLVNTKSRCLVIDKAVELKMRFQFSSGELSKYQDSACLSSNTEECFAFLPVTDTSIEVYNNHILAASNKAFLCMHILPSKDSLERNYATYYEFSQGRIEFDIQDMMKGSKAIHHYDPVIGAVVIDIPDYQQNMEKIIKISAKTDSTEAVPIRFLVKREGKSRLLECGRVLKTEEAEYFNPVGAFPLGRQMNGYPSGSTWQVSTDIHEFDDYPRPYSHVWMHLYMQSLCSKDSSFEELLHFGWAMFGKRPAAQFCQLSLLGWDDHPHYSGGVNHKAVQLWHQGIINHQEIICMCPESHMSNSVITDIRPIDQKNVWGSNNGGGDLLRYRLSGKSEYLKMRASRCNFPNYGPWLGSVRYHLTSEEDAITGDVTAHILAANDISRVYYEAEYRILKDIEVEDLVLVWLGCPGYDYSRFARYAWGKGNEVIEDSLIDIRKGHGEEIIEHSIGENTWFSVYRGGVVDEQFREPNGNKGLIYRGGCLKLCEHPEASVKARKVRIDKFHGLTTQIWLGVSVDNQIISLKKGDMIRVSWEYAPTLKYADDYGLAGDYSKTYKDILEKHPDSYAMIKYEAIHGNWDITSKKGAVMKDGLFPTIEADCGEAEFVLKGGSGFIALRILLDNKPSKVVLEENIQGEWFECICNVSGYKTYQLEYADKKWIISFLLKGGAASIDSLPLERKFRFLAVKDTDKEG